MRRVFQLFVLTLLTVAELHAQGVRFTATSANVSGAGEAIKINLTEWSPDSRRDEFVAAWTLTATTPQGRGGRAGGGGGGAGAAAGRGAAGRGARGGAAPAIPAAAPAGDVPPDPDAVDPDNPAPARGRGGRGGGGGGGNAAAQTPESSLAAALKKAPTVGILWTSENVGYSIKYAYHLPQPDGGERIILATDRRVGVWSNLWKPGATVTAIDYPFSIIEIHVDSKGSGDGRGVLSGKVAVDGTAKTIALDGYPALPIILKGVKRQP
jgi:hypothetical protein